jgi:hypothetical protein
VKDLKPQELAAYLAAHETVVVQFTSPDRKCRYCLGAAEAYARAVAPAKDPSVKFARVQWPVWHKFPDFGKVEKPFGVPEQLIYSKGEVIGSVSGKPGDARVFLAKVQQARDNPMNTTDRQRAYMLAAQEPAKPMSAQEDQLVRIMARKDFMTELLSTCEERYPEVRRKVQRAHRDWLQSQEKDLDSAAIVILARSNHEDAKLTISVADRERRKLQIWATDHAGLLPRKTPEAGECLTMAGSLGSLPPIGQAGAGQ